jgi:hypothetical protein
MKWMYKGKEFNDEDIPEGAFGFVYGMSVVIGSERKMYIGKKNFYSETNVKLGKKALAERTDKRASKRKLVRKLKYANYHSSNKVLAQARKDGLVIERTILLICYCKAELTYKEVEYLFITSALEDKRYLNDNILGKFYRSRIKCETNKNKEDE